MKKETMYMIGAGVVGFLAIRWYLNSRNESTSNATGTPMGGSCQHPNNSVCQEVCENRLNGNFNSSDRKCYKNGMVVTGGLFGNRRKAVSKSYSSACGCGA